MALAASARAQTTFPESLHVVAPADGKTREYLTVVVEADCQACIDAYTEIVARLALHDPLLERYAIRWIPAGADGPALNAAARALQKNSMDGFGAPQLSPPDEKYLRMARENTQSMQNSKGFPMFMASNKSTLTGYTNWNDFANWLSSAR